jgi:hypothetical protein
MDYILGILLGIALLAIFKVVYLRYDTYNKLNKPLDIYINSDISSFTFIERKNTFVKIQYDKDCYLGILINTKNVSVFIKDALTIYLVDENKNKMEYLYNKLVDGFYNDIFINITEVNGSVFSNNLLVPHQENDMFSDSEKFNIANSFAPSIDDILDKINKTGLGSLTVDELNILRQNS